MGELFQSLGLFIAGGVTIACFTLVYRLVFGNKSEYERNRRRAGGFLQTMRGEVPAIYDGTRDSRVSAGIAIKNGEWIEQGKLSSEAVASALRRAK